MRVTLERWGADDHTVLERLNAPEMTVHLGGAETPEQVAARQARYLRSWEIGDAWMYRIDVDGVLAGGIGYWQVDHREARARRAGASTPSIKAAGVAREALRQIVRLAASHHDRPLLVAYPGIDSAASNAPAAVPDSHTPAPRPRRGAAASSRTTCGSSICRRWISPVASPTWTSRSGRACSTRRCGGRTTRRTGRAASARRRGMSSTPTDSSCASTRTPPPWAPDPRRRRPLLARADLQFSGPVGSSIGQHRSSPVLWCARRSLSGRLWLPQFGVIEVRMAAIRHP